MSQLSYPSESLYLDGSVRSPRGQTRFHSINPASGSILAEYVEASPEDCDGAIQSAMQIALWKAAPCLAAGNTIVYKPAELPPGTFNVVQGSGSVGSYLTAHPIISKVSFTGQVTTGTKVACSVAKGMKYVTMELGGKSPLIILEDCDIENAVNGAMMANLFASGQICTNGIRVFVPIKIQKQFEDALKAKLGFVRIGSPEDPKTNFGPLSSQMHLDKVKRYIQHGIQVDQAMLVHGGEQKPDCISADLANGYRVTPTVFSDCTDTTKIVQEEIFGPVMTMLTYETVDEVVVRANNTPLGLAAGVFGRDHKVMRSIVKRLQAGITWINTWGEGPASMSVGGHKMSGLGVENGKGGLSGCNTNGTCLNFKAIDSAGCSTSQCPNGFPEFGVSDTDDGYSYFAGPCGSGWT
ncbi:betaine aldehyde dehydrogenase [Fusarium mexicanum]|uniref:aldehyde dehydrogenase (NAD(+)) n=1 Tax=Fusarium mexicanum TaxID=751941 RepID=A0A8H5MMV0_9HYPO|nr:betaine aldehyde dehydrogenase [Fusarium mexicanum]